MLNDWDTEMDRGLEEARQQQDEQKQLKLQRKLTHRRLLEEDEWVGIFFDSIEKSIDLTPFELLKKHISENTADFISNEMKEWTTPHDTIQEPFSPLISSTSSPLSTPPSSPDLHPAKSTTIKPLPYDTRINLAIAEVHKGNASRRSIAKKFRVNQTTLQARLDDKPTMADKANSQHLLTLLEEQAILNFIDEATGYGFPARLYMIVEKAALLISLQMNNPPPIGIHWVRRFVNRHSQLRSRFLRHLDQE